MSLRNLFLIVLSMSTLNGCFYNQYFTVSSPQLVSDAQGLAMENDSVLITYQCMGISNASKTIRVRIHNKTSQPLYINWSRSVVVVKGETKVFAEATPAPSITTPSQLNTSPPTQMPEKEVYSIILPYATAESDPIELPVVAQKSHTEGEKRWIYTDQTGSTTLRIKHFTPEKTPLQFHTSLTFGVPFQPEKLAIIEHSFYISEVVTGSLNWNGLKADPAIPMDYTPGTKLHDTGTTAGGLFLLLVTCGVIITYQTLVDK